MHFFFENKFTHISWFLAYSIIFQVIRISSQVYEITILRKRISLVIGIRVLSIAFLLLGLMGIKFLGLSIGLLIFLLARIIPVFAIRLA